MHAAADTAKVSVTVAFKPRNPALLAQLAGRGSGAPPVPMATLERLFAPSTATVSATAAYLRSHGLAQSSSGMLTRTFTGTVAQAESAFGSRLATYRANGVTYRSPQTAPTLPAAIAPAVANVSGLDTYPTAQPMAVRTPGSGTVQPHVSGCSDSDTAQATPPGGGHQPADLAASGVYNYQPLLDAGDNGGGETLALVEFSNYDPNSVAAYQTCYGTSVPISVRKVGAGTSDQSGADEVELDMEVAAANAPGLDGIKDYEAAPTAAMSSVLDAILTDNQSTTPSTVVSISWGLCEPATPDSEITAADTEFQLLAANGISVYASSGDDGSTDCHSIGYDGLAVDYPASDPYVTGVGGTTLKPSGESAWGSPATVSGGGGGGGVSIDFPMPSWQTGTGVITAGQSSMSACGQTSRYCREVPDVALDANPDTGYIMDIDGQWTQGGGTSAAAPLMAAITADANEYSLANGGGRLGFASTFFYAHPNVFHDVGSGSNSLTSQNSPYTAHSGYDMATGLGSPNAQQLAGTLAAVPNTGPASSAATKLTAGVSRGYVTANSAATITGTLTSNGQPVAHEQVLVDFSYRYNNATQSSVLWATTGTAGKYTIKVSTGAIKSSAVWYASFLGDQGYQSSHTVTSTMHVMPVLTLGSSLHWNGKSYSVKHGKIFSLNGLSKPVLAGQKVTIQLKKKGAKSWKGTGVTAVVGSAGKYTIKVEFGAKWQGQVRFARAGSTSGQWLTAYSPARAIKAT